MAYARNDDGTRIGQSFSDVCRPHRRGLTVESASITGVGMLLVVTSLMDAGALGTSHIAQSSVANGTCGACERPSPDRWGMRSDLSRVFSDCGSNGIHSLQNAPKVRP